MGLAGQLPPVLRAPGSFYVVTPSSSACGLTSRSMAAYQSSKASYLHPSLQGGRKASKINTPFDGLLWATWLLYLNLISPLTSNVTSYTSMGVEGGERE